MKKIKYAIFAGTAMLISACNSPVLITHEVCEGLFIVKQSNASEFKQHYCMK